MHAQVTTLLREAERLDNRSLDDFIANVISLRTRRSHTQQEEAILLQKINKGLSSEQIQRLRMLNQQQQATGLNASDQAKLNTLVEKMERLNVHRLHHLTALTRLRNLTVRELMHQIGICPTPSRTM